MSSEALTPISIVDTFIHKILSSSPRYEKYKDDFVNIRVYGTIEKPLFVALDVYRLCQEKKEIDVDDKYRKHFERVLVDYIDDSNDPQVELIRGVEIIVIAKRGESTYDLKRKVNMLTEFGIYRMLYSSSKKIGSDFRSFINCVLVELKNKGVAELNSALLERDNIIKHRENEIKKLEEIVTDKTIKLEHRDNKIREDFEKITEYYNELELLKPLKCYVADPTVPADPTKVNGLALYEKTYGKCLIIYILCDTMVIDTLKQEFAKKGSRGRSIKKKPVIIHDSDEDTLVPKEEPEEEPPQDDDAVDIDNLDLVRYDDDGVVEFRALQQRSMGPFVEQLKTMDSDPELYLQLSPLNAKPRDDTHTSKLFTKLYFFNNKHYEDFIAKLKDETLATRMNRKLKSKVLQDVYLTTFSLIRDVHETTFNKICISDLMDNMNVNAPYLFDKVESPQLFPDDDVEIMKVEEPIAPKKKSRANKESKSELNSEVKTESKRKRKTKNEDTAIKPGRSAAIKEQSNADKDITIKKRTIKKKTSEDIAEAPKPRTRTAK